MRLQESGEMYLETIYVLLQKNEKVRSLDIAEYMGFSKPSVSRAVGLLKKEGYLVADENGYFSLTEQGNNIAASVYERHIVLTKMLTMMGVDEITASQDACKMEHGISEKSLEAIKKHIAYKKQIVKWRCYERT